VDNDEPLNPVEQFVYDNEPSPSAGESDDAWRASLLKALERWSAER
jgi:hypothetical protein